nr:site-specific DNA-methyltransferase [Methylobacterium sp. OTU13CASTA1]
MGVRILTGDCRTVLATLPDESVHCVVTSPPYFGLRDYGVEGQIGLEDTPAAFVAEMVAVFRDVRRVLRRDGTLWLNLGDTYGKDKQLLMIPARVALAMKECGWICRSEIIWNKPNAMPTSVKDRPTTSHEYVYMFAKSSRYYYDAASVRVPFTESSLSRAKYARKARERDRGGRTDGFTTPAAAVPISNGGRNIRTVWTIPPEPFRGAHFAVFPSALVEPCVKAGCPIGGIVLDPFGGAGTTGLVANRLGRQAILIELNPDYAEIARSRLARDGGMFAAFSGEAA